MRGSDGDGEAPFEVLRDGEVDALDLILVLAPVVEEAAEEREGVEERAEPELARELARLPPADLVEVVAEDGEVVTADRLLARAAQDVRPALRLDRDEAVVVPRLAIPDDLPRPLQRPELNRIRQRPRP